MDKQVAYFRMAYGFMMAVHLVDLLMSGGISYYFIDPVIHLKYPLLEWVDSPQDNWVHALVILTMIASVTLAAGLITRISSLFIALIYGWLLFSDVSFFKHHHYLFWLISVLLVIIPSNRSLSLDRILFKGDRPGISLFELFVLRAMMVIPYFFGGVSKLLNEEWTSGRTVGFILEQKFEDLPMVEALGPFMTFGGLTFDLLIPFLFFIPRTRIAALVLALCFNVSNFFLFTIDVFPFVMLSGALLFFQIGNANQRPSGTASTSGVLKTACLSAFLVFQVLFPFRHLLIQGNMYLTGEGYMAGWNMIDSLTRTEINVTVADKEKKLNYSVEAVDYLTKRQVSTVGRFPEFLPQVANHIATKASMWNIDSVAVFVDIKVSRNGTPPVRAIEHKMDLVGKRSEFLKHSKWILIDQKPIGKDGNEKGRR